jgi:asparagine synthase (glutamine-hydrolysing)
MCGIAGYFGLADDLDLLRGMHAAQQHRGPDGEGYFTEGPVGFAHSLLAIIDRAHGAQPMTDANNRFVICYNGEVYNHDQLREELRGLGHNFTTACDTEVVVEAFAEWREAAFDRFNGMFALAIYDKHEERLFLARDHFGIKPLYVVRLPGETDLPRVLFASEIKALLFAPQVPREVNERILYRYLRSRVHDDGVETFFAGVERLLPGEMMIVDRGGVRRQMFCDLRTQLRNMPRQRRYNPADHVEYAEQLRRSVRMRLMSEVPVGSCLSGGLDSSTIALLIDQLLVQQDASARPVGAQQNTFSAVFPGSRNDEERYADAVLDRTQGRARAHKVRPSADTFAEDLRDFVRTQEEPTISTGPYAQYKVMQEAARHVTVLLDGQGADEMLAGYYPYYLVRLRQLRREQGVVAAGIEAVRSRDVLWRLLRTRLWDRLHRRRSVDPVTLLGDEFAAEHAQERFSPVLDDLRERLLQDMFQTSLPSLLRYEDKNSMRFGVEGRVPFLDVAAVRHLFSLTDEAIIKGAWNKRVLRDATRGLLPELVRTRRNKIGFTTPEDEWVQRLKTRFYEVFRSESFGRRPYFDQAAVLSAFKRYIGGRGAADTDIFWRLLNVELWLREFFDEEPAEIGVGYEACADKSDLAPNEGKPLDVEVGGDRYRRYPLQIRPIAADDDLPALVQGRLQTFFPRLAEHSEHRGWQDHDWWLIISEKVVAITQGRSFFVWQISPGRWARFLSHHVARTPYGIGLGSPETMQLAIQEAGLPRILLAALVGAAGKPLGRHGDFYRVAGSAIAAIDGPTEYSVYPSNLSAKLPPAQPNTVAAQLSDAVRTKLPSDIASRFQGTVVIDANDLGCEVLGTDRRDGTAILRQVFADNPLGQGQELTPICVMFAGRSDEAVASCDVTPVRRTPRSMSSAGSRSRRG